MPRTRALDAAVVRFGRLLRIHGVAASAETAVEALRALEVVDLGDRDEVRLALRAVFPSSPGEVAAFDRCFDAFWRTETPGPPEVNEFPLPPPPEKRRDRRPTTLPWQNGAAAPGRTALKEWAAQLDEEDPDGPLSTAVMSDLEALVAKDFSMVSGDELGALLRLTRRMARRLAGRLRRGRRRAARRGPVDLRRTLRRNLARGELLDLARRAAKPTRPRLVALCDVSGSMDVYTGFLLQFLYALQRAFDRMETFAFSTRLTRVTDHLRSGRFALALERLRAVEDWSSGTRIGESLERFNRDWAERLVDRRTLVMILSDGWDTGDPDLLTGELLALRRRARKVVWLNPLLGQPSYEPITRGMAAALPLVHAFLPAHNLTSLRALERVLHD